MYIINIFRMTLPCDFRSSGGKLTCPRYLIWQMSVDIEHGVLGQDEWPLMRLGHPRGSRWTFNCFCRVVLPEGVRLVAFWLSSLSFVFSVTLIHGFVINLFWQSLKKLQERVIPCQTSSVPSQGKALRNNIMKKLSAKNHSNMSLFVHLGWLQRTTLFLSVRVTYEESCNTCKFIGPHCHKVAYNICRLVVPHCCKGSV